MFFSWIEIAIAIGLVFVLGAAAGFFTSKTSYSRRITAWREKLYSERLIPLNRMLGLVEREVLKRPVGVFSKPTNFHITGIEAILDDMSKKLAKVYDKLQESSKNTDPIIIPRKDESENWGQSSFQMNEDTTEKKEWVSTEKKRESEELERHQSLSREREEIIESSQPETEMKLASLYNQANNKRELRDALWQQFQITEIENINAIEQRLGNTLEPEFRQSDSGNFYAIKSPSENTFWIIPKFDLTVKPTNYENTVKFIFDCENYNENETYSLIQVLKPAVFVKDGENWRKSQKGKLFLSQ